MGENPALPPTNRNAIISLITAILTLLSFCIAASPIPFTGPICYPPAAGLGLVSLATGLASLRQIRSNGENGRGYALIGVWIGGLTTLAALCAMVLGIMLLPVIVNFIRQVSR